MSDGSAGGTEGVKSAGGVPIITGITIVLIGDGIGPTGATDTMAEGIMDGDIMGGDVGEKK